MAKVLVVEDERVVAWNIQETLESFNYTVVANVASGSQAIDIARETQPDIVLMDIRLTGEMDGITAATQIQSWGIPVVYLTAHADEQTLQRAMATNPFGYLLKPFNRMELHTTIETTLRRSQLEKQLAATQQQLAVTLNSIGDGTIAIDQQGCITFMNPVAEELTGWQQDEALGSSIQQVFKLIDSVTRQTIENPLSQAIQQGRRIRLPDDCLLQTKQGAELQIGDSASPIKNQLGEIIGGVLVFQDISERKSLEARLRAQANREYVLNQVIRAIRNSLDLTTIFETATAEICTLLQADRVSIVQYLPERAIWLNVSDYLSRPELPNALGLEISEQNNEISNRLKRLETFQVTDPSASTDEINRQYADIYPGVWLMVPMQINASLWGCLNLIRDDAKGIWQEDEIAIAQTIADQLAIAIHQSQLYVQVRQLSTTLEQQVEQRTAQLQQSLNYEAALKRITDRVRDSLDEDQIWQSAVEELAIATGVRGCNASVYDLPKKISTIKYEYTTFDSSFVGYTPHMENFQEGYNQLLQGQHFQFCGLTSYQNRPQVAMLACPIMDDQSVLGDIWLIHNSEHGFEEPVIRLVQQVANQCAIALRQARLYHAAQTQVEELNRLNRLKDEFLNSISHELRTPLANIKMAAQMIELSLSRMGLLDGELNSLKRYLQIIAQENEQETQLINHLIDLSLLEAEVEPLFLTTIDLQEWLPQITEPFQARMQQQQQQLELRLARQDLFLTTDLFYLERIFNELLDNACQFTPINERIILSAEQDTDYLQLKIANTGIEIPDNELPRIFEKFYRGSGKELRPGRQAGLGLSLVKKLVLHIGALIWVESRNQQTTFTVMFDAKHLGFR